jgi:hypothetical protein
VGQAADLRRTSTGTRTVPDRRPEVFDPPDLELVMRAFRTLTLLALFTAPVGAQDQQRPEGWKVRFDRPGSTEADLEMFVEMPPGWHITTGPAGIFWNPAMTASGSFRAELEVFLFDPGDRREAFGIFFGGQALETDDQAYTYFLIRNGGEFLLKGRKGSDTPTLQGWTSHAAIQSYADRGDAASVLNVLAVHADAETVRFFVNDEEVATLPRSQVDTDGTVGIRVNHALNLHVARLEVVPAG